MYPKKKKSDRAQIVRAQLKGLLMSVDYEIDKLALMFSQYYDSDDVKRYCGEDHHEVCKILLKLLSAQQSIRQIMTH